MGSAGGSRRAIALVGALALLDQFGADRVIDAPISEVYIAGGSVGAALVGMRPVAEIQFADFITAVDDLAL